MLRVAALHDLLGLRGLQSIGGSLTITGTSSTAPALVDLHGLEQVTDLETVALSYLPALTRLDGLPAQAKFSQLTVSNAPLLYSLAAMSSTVEIDMLAFGQLPDLADLSGLDSLTSAQLIDIESSGITSLVPLSHVAFNALRLVDDMAVTSLDGMQHVTSIGTLTLRR